MDNTLKIGEMTFQSFSSGAWKGWVNPDWNGVFASLDEWLASSERKVVLETVCRTVARHETPMGAVYSKLMRAGNDGALMKKELFPWLKWALGPARAVTVLKNTAAMLAKGHACPKPLLAARLGKKDGRHLNLLVTEEVKAPTLESIVAGDDSSAKNDGVRLAGEQLAALHADYFIHGDFLPRNTCLDIERHDLIFLDNDKTSRWRIKPPFFLQKRNLDQFCYSLMLLGGLNACSMEYPMIFLRAYSAACKWDVKRRERVFASVIAKAKTRWQNKHDRVIGKGK